MTTLFPTLTMRFTPCNLHNISYISTLLWCNHNKTCGAGMTRRYDIFEGYSYSRHIVTLLLVYCCSRPLLAWAGRRCHGGLPPNPTEAIGKQYLTEVHTAGATSPVPL